MKKHLFISLLLVVFVACKQKENPIVFEKYDETSEIEAQQNHKNDRMKLKMIQSKYNDMNEVFKSFENDLAYFSEEDYQNLIPFILEKDIPTIQEHVKNRILSYERIALFYLYRIRKYESNNELFLNAIISLNPTILEEARLKDKNKPADTEFSLYGLPILLKDNINTVGMATSAGAFVLKDNQTSEDAFIVKKLKENGALILGKANLSEWAYFFCSGCPVGYSAVGGQTLNPYGRKVFETGGSSSGSGVGVAANYAVAAVGTETSGSILSPSGKNAVVGLKPTIGLLSRTGIVPISSTLDTPGPMTKSVIDNAIFLNAMLGKDNEDEKSVESNVNFISELKKYSLKGKRFGALENLMTDSLYTRNISILQRNGAEIVKINPERAQLNGFLTLLNVDMKYDLPKYLKNHADSKIKITSVSDVVEFNSLDSLKRMPYNQELFDGIVRDSTTLSELEIIKTDLENSGRAYFNNVIDSLKLDAFLSINNYHAGFAAVAKYPCLTVPMGFDKTGEPKNMTFISKQFEEEKLLKIGYAFEKLTKIRKLPKDYK